MKRYECHDCRIKGVQIPCKPCKAKVEKGDPVPENCLQDGEPCQWERVKKVSGKREMIEFIKYARDLQTTANAIMKRDGYQMDNLSDPWQKLAFTLYSDLCELNLMARQVLGEDDEE